MQLAAMLLAVTAFVAMDAAVWLANLMFVLVAALGVVLIVLLETTKATLPREAP
jgi:hypothetical protein